MGRKCICDLVPDEVLLCALDYLTLADVLVLMRVSKRWFALAVEHPIYWQKLVLHARNDSAHYGHGVDLIRRRLSGSNGRPFDLTLDLREPRSAVAGLLKDVRRHLSHIETLEISTSVDFVEVLFDALGARAPLLQSFKLVLRPATTGFPYPVVTLPAGIFDSYAPLLVKASFSNVCLPDAPTPGLGHIEELEMGCTWLWECMVTRGLFPLCGRLRTLTLTGDVIVDRPQEGWDVDKWESLEALVFNGTPISHSWHTLNLPITNTSDVAVLHGDAISIAVLADQVHGSLRATLAFLPDSGELDLTFSGTSPRDGHARTRRVSAPVTEEDDDAVLRELSNLARRITSLSTPLAVWHRMAGAVASMPNLVDLHLLADGEDLHDGSGLGEGVSCPSLLRVAVSSRPTASPVWSPLEDLADFASSCIKDAPHPVSLNLAGAAPE